MARYTNAALSTEFFNKLQPGIKGEIVVNAGIYKGRYASRVEDTNGSTVGFAHPLISGALLPAYRDLNFDFIMEDGGALYIFDMAVRRVDVQTGLPIMWAVNVGEARRVQRRQFLRVSCLWNIMIFHMDYESRNPMAMKWLPAKAIDISLGGYRFRLMNEDAGEITFEMDELILVRFNLADRDYLQLGRTSRIVRTQEGWEIGVGFDSLPSSVEKKLFEYIRQQEILWREE